MSDIARNFHLSDILSVTTGRLVSTRHISGVYDILNFMTGDNLFTHQLPRACRECEPVLKLQHPQLAEIAGDDCTPENHQEWLAGMIARYGETLPVEPVADGVHERIDPVSELAEKIHPSKIIVAQP